MKKFTPAFDEFAPAFWQNTPGIIFDSRYL